ncbi:MAG: hypothetical protein LBC61_00810 [Candidatus Peribacteria bacterium]|nr:hypothetical protein [Candidatus Peribacteria bacterium]
MAKKYDVSESIIREQNSINERDIIIT